MESKTFHRTTGRILDILELIASNPNTYTLSAISQVLNVPKSSISPILQELVNRGYLCQTIEQKYSIGLSLYDIGSGFLKQFNFLEEVEKYLVNMTNVCNEASHFSVLSGGDVLYLKKVNSPEPIRMVSYIGNKIPAYSTALGKSLLLDFSPAQLHQLYPDGLTKVTPNTITDFNILINQLNEGREKGYTYEIEESNQFIRCIAVPIRKENHVVAAISIATPIFRYTDEKEQLTKTLLFDAKKKIEYLVNRINIDFEDLL